MSFFIRGKSKHGKPTKKTKQPVKVKGAITKKRKFPSVDEDIPSDEDEEELMIEDKKTAEVYSSDEDTETAQEKRLRLAKDYLAQLEEEEYLKHDDDVDGTTISDRLKEDVLEQSGGLQKNIAQNYLPVKEEDIHILRGHQLPITCLVITPDDRHIFSGSKDCTIIKWDIHTRKKEKIIARRKKTDQKSFGHMSHVMCLAISSDGQFLASGDNSSLILIWDAVTCQHLHTFKGHRGSISGLAFRRGSHQLFSSSHDRTVKIWNVDEMVYVETLFGHQDGLTAIDCLTRERAVTAGGRDGTIRIWKVLEESQLVFKGHRGSIDCVALINEGHFVSGADDNSLALWNVAKKKPQVVVQKAHKSEENGDAKTNENWITSLAALQNTDLIASAGSKDGCIRLWHCGGNFHKLKLLFTIPLVGFVNSMKFSNNGDFLVAGIGQEHRLGRWWKIKESRNHICIINLQRSAVDNKTSISSSAQKNRWTSAKE